ncbi:hypothetical protein SASPL_137937 [Salvia splendens]|uniref:Uncharacterized protein n=1 Tax=Salvia splendens TaxID=180675 RepID=A0A8X8WUD1_SALSN|nr:hypothetical protein SASPL_137937 [Salvia splendens]
MIRYEMKRRFFLVSLFLLYHSALASPNSPWGLNVFQAAGRRVLMSDATKVPDTALVAALDAPVNDKENASGVETNYFIDCGDDWELYSLDKLYESETESNIKTNELTRTDYTLTSFLPNSDKVLWNVTVAEIGAAFLCQDVDKSLTDTLPDESLEPDLPYKMPLLCQSRALVFRLRNQNTFETLSLANWPSKALNHDMMLPASTADVLPPQPNVENVLELLPVQNNGGKFLDGLDSKDIKGILPSDAFKYVVPRTNALAVQATGTSYTNVRSKRKKSRKAGKSGSFDGKQDKEDNEVQHTHTGSDNVRS